MLLLGVPSNQYTYQIHSINNISPQGLVPPIQNGKYFLAESSKAPDFHLYVSAEVALAPNALDMFYPYLDKLRGNVLFGSIGYLDSNRSELFFIPMPQKEFYEGIKEFPYVMISRKKITVSPIHLLELKNSRVIPEVVGYTSAFGFKKLPNSNEIEKNNTPGISIVIPTCGKLNKSGKTFIVECVKSLIQSLGDDLYQIIVVYDGTDVPSYLSDSVFKSNSIEFVSFPEKKFNFSKKVNLGVRTSKFDRILLLNDDTKALTTNWNCISHSLEAKTSAGIIGALLFYDDFKVQHFGVTVGRGGYNNFLAGKSLDDPLISKEIVTRQASAVTGAWLLTSQKVWNEILGFDEMLPNNFGDIDFCLRARAAGYKVVLTPDISFFHFESQSRITDVSADELRYFQIRWASGLTDDKFLPSPAQISNFIEVSQKTSLLRRALKIYIAEGCRGLILRTENRIMKMTSRNR